MKITILVDNNTLIDRYFLGEPAVSYLVEDGDVRVLFDVGYSDAFVTNARKMHIDLLQNDFVVLSHGHLDHTWGMDSLLKLYTEAAIESISFKKPVLVACPDVFHTKTIGNLNEIGTSIPEAKLERHFDVKLSKDPVWLTDRLVFLGEIPRCNDFENQKPVGKVHKESSIDDDFLPDDTALAYKSAEGLVVITGCSHAGICNIIEHAKNVCGDERIVDVVGGFHLMQPSREQLDGTVAYFKKLKSRDLHACHCVDLDSKIALSKVAHLSEVGVGLQLKFDE